MDQAADELACVFAGDQELPIDQLDLALVLLSGSVLGEQIRPISARRTQDNDGLVLPQQRRYAVLGNGRHRRRAFTDDAGIGH
jgi:hypothetical protein